METEWQKSGPLKKDTAATKTKKKDRRKQLTQQILVHLRDTDDGTFIILQYVLIPTVLDHQVPGWARLTRASSGHVLEHMNFPGHTSTIRLQEPDKDMLIPQLSIGTTRPKSWNRHSWPRADDFMCIEADGVLPFLIVQNISVTNTHAVVRCLKFRDPRYF